MTSRQRAVLAIGFFVFWLAVLAAGADHPPPPGFVLVVLADGVLAAGGYLRLPHWQRRGGGWQALAEGGMAGVVVAVVFALLPHAPEPGLPPPALLDDLIGVSALAFVGALSAGALWGVARLWTSRR